MKFDDYFKTVYGKFGFVSSEAELKGAFNAGLKEGEQRGITALRNVLVNNAESTSISIWIDLKVKEMEKL